MDQERKYGLIMPVLENLDGNGCIYLPVPERPGVMVKVTIEVLDETSEKTVSLVEQLIKVVSTDE